MLSCQKFLRGFLFGSGEESSENGAISAFRMGEGNIQQLPGGDPQLLLVVVHVVAPVRSDRGVGADAAVHVLGAGLGDHIARYMEAKSISATFS